MEPTLVEGGRISSGRVRRLLGVSEELPHSGDPAAGKLG
jgi:hypothetical protein